MRPLTFSGPPPGPFTLTAGSGRVLTWPDPMVWQLPQAAAWMHHLTLSPMAVFGPLDDEDDRRALSTMTTADAKALAGDLLEHYTAAWASPSALARLHWILERYPGAVLWDLTPRGVDVRAWVEQRRWGDLALVLDELPPASAVHEAMQEDPEWVEQQVQAETDAGGVDTSSSGWRPRVREYDLGALQLAAVSAGLDSVATAVMQVAHEVAYQHSRSKPSFSPPKTRGFPSPRTLLDIRRDAVVAEETWALYDMFQPGRKHTAQPSPDEGGWHGQQQQEQDPPDDRE